MRATLFTIACLLTACGVNTEPILQEGDVGGQDPTGAFDAAGGEPPVLNASDSGVQESADVGVGRNVDAGPALLDDERSLHCDDDSEVLCDAEPQECEPGEVAALREGCWVCVLVGTCQEGPCVEAEDCGPGYTCNECARASCDGCEDCIGACEPVECTEGETLAYTCPVAGYQVPWCTCGPEGMDCIEDPRAACCGDGSAVECEELPEDCPEGTSAASYQGCNACVDAAYCGG